MITGNGKRRCGAPPVQLEIINLMGRYGGRTVSAADDMDFPVQTDQRRRAARRGERRQFTPLVGCGIVVVEAVRWLRVGARRKTTRNENRAIDRRDAVMSGTAWHR